jgi:ABC-type oligopeptide transport system substrate-binding subunit
VAPLFLLSWVADLSDPDSFLRTLFESDGASNFFDFHDAETGALLDEGARETNPAKRTEIYRRCESRTLQLAPLVPLYYPISYLAARRRVRGLEVGPLGISNVRLDRVWLARAGGAPA